MFKFIALFFSLATAAFAVSIDSNVRQTVSRRDCVAQLPLICHLTPVSGSSVSGAVWFTPNFRKKRCDVRIRARVTGLNGTRHGFHIHQYGDISSGTGLSTGPHFTNPEGTPIDHGFSADAIRHWGDFGSLVVRRGRASYNRADSVISLAGIVGHGITIHLGRDNGPAFQPTGASGPRIAVCVIGFANPDTISSL